MKRLLYFCGLFFLVGACHSDLFPTDPLYQRWILVQYRQGTGPWVAVLSLTANDTEYKRDGSLTYRRDGQVQPIEKQCCAPSRFSRQQNEINFTNPVICPNALCLAVLSSKVTINQLTGDSLQLVSGQTISQYIAIH